MAASPCKFPTYILSDLAERTRGQIDRITFDGNHVSHQMLLPVRGEGERPETYAARCEEFRKRIPRHWDHAKRLALAHEYYVRQGYSTWKAAYLVRTEALPEALRIAAQERASLGKIKILTPEKTVSRIKLKAIKLQIGKSRRRRRTTRKRPGLSKIDRQVESVRAEAMRFKRNCPNFRQLYESTFGIWRSEFGRDPEWYAEAELLYKMRAEVGGPMPSVSLAVLEHEQGKHSDAEVNYCRARELYESLPAPEPVRSLMLSWIDTQIANCRERKGPDRPPVIGIEDLRILL